MKQKLSSIAALLLMVGLLMTACAPQAALAPDAATGSVTVSVFTSPEGMFGDITGDTYSYKLIAEATGINLEITRGVLEQEDEKLGTLFASGDVPDVIQMVNKKWVNEYGSKGLFAPLDTYIDSGKMPNFKDQMEKRKIPWGDITSGDGHIYQAPMFDDIRWVTPALLMRADLLQNCGIIADKNNPGPPNVIATVDDLKNAFQCLKKELNGETVIGNRNGFQAMLKQMSTWFGTSYNQYYNPVTKTYEYGPLMARYRVMVEFFNWLYTEKMLHPDYATQTDAEMSALHDSGVLGAALQNIGWNYDRLRGKGIDPGKDFFVQSLTIDGEKVLWSTPTQLAGWNAIVVSASSSPEKIDAAIRLIDFLYSDKGAELAYYGKEGVEWKVGDNGKACFLGTILYRKHTHSYCDQKIPENAPSFIQYSLLGGNLLMRINSYGWMDKWPGVDNPDTWPNRWGEVYSQFTGGGSMADTFPVISLTDDENGVIAQVGTPLETYVTEETQKFVEGGRPLTDAEWSAFTDKIKELEAQKVVDVYNAALSRKK